MRNNRRRVKLNQEEESKRIIYISVAIFILAVIVFITTYIIYSNNLNKSSDLKLGKISEYSTIKNEETSQTSTSIGKSVNEIVEDNKTNNESKIKDDNTNKSNNSETKKKDTDEKIAINTSSIVKSSNKNEKNTNMNNETTKTNAEIQKGNTTNSFIKPVEGEIIKEFAQKNFVYSETLKEWITHNGIDIKAEEKTIVKASSDGTIKSINNDPKYGLSIVIEHSDGYQTIYANLMTAEFVKEGETIKQGQTIGTIGKTATFEIADESHLHFELLKDGKYLDPSEYIK